MPKWGCHQELSFLEPYIRDGSASGNYTPAREMTNKQGSRKNNNNTELADRNNNNSNVDMIALAMADCGLVMKNFFKNVCKLYAFHM